MYPTAQGLKNLQDPNLHFSLVRRQKTKLEVIDRLIRAYALIRYFKVVLTFTA